MSSSETANQGRLILLGRVLGALGLKGDVKIESFTDPRHAIFRYQPWTLKRNERSPNTLAQVQADFSTDLMQYGVASLQGVKGREQGKHLAARLPGVSDRNAAEAVVGLDIYVERSQLPPPAEGEFYWIDLEGLRVVNLEGANLGTVSHLFGTGANDVIAVRDDSRERLIPFVRPQFVTDIDFEQGLITVDWDPEF